jgi:hypothetical protein
LIKVYLLEIAVDILKNIFFSMIGMIIFLNGPIHAQQGDPVALVLEIEGPTTPSFEPYTEIAESTIIDLGSDSNLSFSHLGLCQKITLIGGIVRIERGHYRQDGGKVVSESQMRCPRRYQIKGNQVSAGLLLRGGIPKSPDVTTRPSFVLVGPGAASFNLVQVSKEDALIIAIVVVGRYAAWPEGALGLESGTTYTVKLIANDTTDRTVEFDITPVLATDSLDMKSMVILKIQ